MADTVDEQRTMTGAEVLANAKRERMGFLTEVDMAIIASDSKTKTTLVLVRCGGGRFLATADQAQHFINLIEQSGRTVNSATGHGETDYVRDISLPANVKVGL